MMKRILAFALILALLLTMPLLYACGDGTTDDQTPDDGETKDPAGDTTPPD